MRLSKKLLLALFSFFLTAPAFASGPLSVQVIHNSPDPALANVKVWASLDGTNFLALPGLEDVAYRQASDFFEVDPLIAPATLSYPATLTLRFTAANAVDADNSLADIAATFDSFGSYHLIASGVATPGDFPIPAGTDAAFGVKVVRRASTAGTAPAGNLNLGVHHGSPDAPSVDIYVDQVSGNIVTNASFGDTDYSNTVAPGTYTIRVRAAGSTDNVATYRADLSAVAADAYVLVLASGFLTADQPNPFGLIAVLADGTVITLEQIHYLNSRVQVVHNAADPALTPVAISASFDGTTFAPLDGLDNVPFRGASAFFDLENADVELPATVQLRFSTVPTNGGSSDVLATVPVEITANGSYYLVASGVATPGDFLANPGDVETGFTVLAHAAPTEVPSDKVHLVVHHGATDAPAVDVYADAAGANIVTNAAYQDFSAEIPLDPNAYTVRVRANGSSDDLFIRSADVTGAAGQGVLVLASGFLNTDQTPPAAKTSDNPGFALIAVLEDGTVITLQEPTARASRLQDASLALYPNPATHVANIRYSQTSTQQVSLLVRDITGRVVESRELGSLSAGTHQFAIQTQAYASGMYNVTLTTASGAQLTQKLSVLK